MVAAAARRVCGPDSSLAAQSRPRRSSQQLEDVHGHGAAQVLPRLLPRRVPQVHVSVEFVHQQADDVLVAVDGGNVEGGVATG